MGLPERPHCRTPPNAPYRPPTHLADALDRFAASRACFLSKNRVELCPDGRNRPMPAAPPPRTLAAGVTHRPAPPPASPKPQPPSDLDRMAQIQSKLGSNQTHTGQPLSILQKSPSICQKSTRDPPMLKSIYKVALYFLF